MTGQQPGRGPGYIPAIDGLRAVAVGSVMLFHLWPPALPGGFTGVDIFFVISGFVVTGSLMGRQFDSLGAFAAYFYARRLMRIMPALLAMLLTTLLAGQLFIPDAWLSDSLAQVGRFAFFGLSNLVLAIDTDSYFGPQAVYNPFTHTWSLGVEEQFYLAFPFLLYWHQRLHQGRAAVRFVAGISLGSLALCAVLSFAAPKFAFYLIFTRFWELGAGMLLCLTIATWRPCAEQRGSLLAAVGALAIGAGFAIPEGGPFPFPLALPSVLGTAAVIASVCAARGTWLSRVLGNRAVVGVGLLSYSLYLWHWPVFVLFRWTTGLDTPALALAALGVTVILACLSYWLVERPLRGLRTMSDWPRVRVVNAALAATLIAAIGGQGLIAAHDRLTLSVTHDRAAWHAEPGRPLDPGLSHCALTETVGRVGGGIRTGWTPSGCTRAPAGFALFMPADSHGLAYTPLLRQLAAELGVPVRRYFKPGCPYLKLVETMAGRAKCAGYYRAVLDDIRRAARPGDMIFLPGLRGTRLVNQFERDHDLEGPHDDSVAPAALAEAGALIDRFAAMGARVVIEAPKPMFRSPAFRCSDWFNRSNPICHGGLTEPRAELLERRTAVVAAMQRLAARQPALSVWDPFPLLCPGDPCRSQPDGRPLFFDGDHLSGLGNDLLYPGLRDTLLALREPSPSGTTRSIARAGP
ncbi:acyltransferase [Sphingomonas sp. JC676]|uniref:acyltransferase family protein n=1 Tax=Sphingomonas sp. JC676 TaxID=2768065 RepID=UPI0016577A0D|nr:acyltransferase family protein [Sphingomonas sp. JC676]MBC9032436.1 acyltransferase [Sphingomonas sp. JC676]